MKNWVHQRTGVGLVTSRVLSPEQAQQWLKVILHLRITTIVTGTITGAYRKIPRSAWNLRHHFPSRSKMKQLHWATWWNLRHHSPCCTWSIAKQRTLISRPARPKLFRSTTFTQKLKNSILLNGLLICVCLLATVSWDAVSLYNVRARSLASLKSPLHNKGNWELH